MNPDIEKNFAQWTALARDPETQKELAAMDAAQKEDAFYRELTFGTGGLRGVLGAGTNRMNVYTVRRATQGLCDTLLEKAEKAPAVAVAYDTRSHSAQFAREAACVLAAGGCTAHLFPTPAPTPMLSFAVRRLSCDAGIVITASHNPAAYNGYKVYGPDGCQITPPAAAEVLAHIRRVDLFRGVHAEPFEEALRQERIRMVPEDLSDEFVRAAIACRVDWNLLAHTNLRVLYTPLNGTGSRPVRRAFALCGFRGLALVPEQAEPDPAFSTCPHPNPEERGAYEKALELAKKHPADLLLATDPDCDRVGVAVRGRDKTYTLLTGNETGCLLLEYLLSQKQTRHELPRDPVVVKTIVTSAMARAIAQAYGARVIDTLTGFKYIGEQIGLLESKGQQDRYVFGFEESYGCLPGTYVRDKDGVAASVLIAEMAAFYKKQGRTLLDALDACYRRYGFWQHKLLSFPFEGETGAEKLRRTLEDFRAGRAGRFAGLAVRTESDYLLSSAVDCRTGKTSPLALPKSDVLAFTLEEGAEVLLRPSGTEPKLKCYLTAKAGSLAAAQDRLRALERDLREKIAGGGGGSRRAAS